LRQWFPELLEEIYLLQRRNMFFQQNGVPHAYREVTNFLNERFPGGWIARTN